MRKVKSEQVNSSERLKLIRGEGINNSNGYMTQQIILFISIALILGIISILALGFTLVMTGSTYGRGGPTGPIGQKGDKGVCLLNDTNQLFVSGNITIEQELILLPNSSILFLNSSIKEKAGECLEIESTLPLCLDVPYIKAQNNRSIFNNMTICFDVNCNSGIGPYFDAQENVYYLNIFGNIILNDIVLPFLIGQNGGYLDQLPGAGGGFLVASNPNSTGGILLNSRGYGIFGNETFNNFITFLKYIILSPSGLRIYVDPKNLSSNIMLDMFYEPNLYTTITSGDVNPFIIQSNQSDLKLVSLIDNITLQTPSIVNIFSPKIRWNFTTFIYNSNLSFDLLSGSNQIGFFTNNTTPLLVGWIRSNNTCPISIGPLLCTNNIKVNSQLTIVSPGILFFETGSKIVANGTLNITAPNVFINTLTTQTFNVIATTNFPGGIITSGIISNSAPNSFSHGVSVDTLIASISLTSSGTLSVGQSSTFLGSSLFLNNVTFNGVNNAQCAFPIFSNIGPNQCLPQCLNFYNCTEIQAISFFGRNSLKIANTMSDLFTNLSSFIIFGVDIDFISSIYSKTISNYSLFTNYTRTKTAIDTEFISGNKMNIISLNQTSITSISMISRIFSPPSCLPLITVSNNASGTPVSVTLNPPYYNYSDSSCNSITEKFEYSNSTILGKKIFMGSAVINRLCTSITGSQAVCTPYFDSTTRDFSFAELLTSPSQTIILNNNTLNKELSNALKYFLFNITNTYPILTPQSLINIASINTSNITTQIDTYTVDSYAFLNLSGESGLINISASKNISIGKDSLNVDPNTGNIVVSGNILAPDGTDHPCCGTSTSTINSKTKQIVLSSSLVKSLSPGSSVLFTPDFSSASTTSIGTLSGWSLSSCQFSAPKAGIYTFGATFQISAATNVTSIGCVYSLFDSSGSFQYYKFAYIWDSYSFLPSDGSVKYLECSDFTILRGLNEKIKINIFIDNPITNTVPNGASMTFAIGSFIKATNI